MNPSELHASKPYKWIRIGSLHQFMRWTYPSRLPFSLLPFDPHNNRKAAAAAAQENYFAVVGEWELNTIAWWERKQIYLWSKHDTLHCAKSLDSNLTSSKHSIVCIRHANEHEH